MFEEAFELGTILEIGCGEVQGWACGMAVDDAGVNGFYSGEVILEVIDEAGAGIVNAELDEGHAEGEVLEVVEALW